MPNTLQVKRGVIANIGTLDQGELFFATDENVLYVGDGAINHGIVAGGGGLTNWTDTLNCGDSDSKTARVYCAGDSSSANYSMLLLGGDSTT